MQLEFITAGQTVNTHGIRRDTQEHLLPDHLRGERHAGVERYVQVGESTHGREGSHPPPQQRNMKRPAR